MTSTCKDSSFPRPTPEEWAVFRAAWRALLPEGDKHVEKLKMLSRPFHEVRGATGSGRASIAGMPSTFERWLERLVDALREECAADAEQLILAALGKSTGERDGSR